MDAIEKVVETLEAVGKKRENLRICQEFLQVGAEKFTNEQWKIIRKILHHK